MRRGQFQRYSFGDEATQEQEGPTYFAKESYLREEESSMETWTRKTSEEDHECGSISGNSGDTRSPNLCD